MVLFAYRKTLSSNKNYYTITFLNCNNNLIHKLINFRLGFGIINKSITLITSIYKYCGEILGEYIHFKATFNDQPKYTFLALFFLKTFYLF